MDYVKNEEGSDLHPIPILLGALKVTKMIWTHLKEALEPDQFERLMYISNTGRVSLGTQAPSHVFHSMSADDNKVHFRKLCVKRR